MDSDNCDDFLTAFSLLWDGIHVLSTEELPDEFLSATWVSAEGKGEQSCRTWAQEASLQASR